MRGISGANRAWKLEARRRSAEQDLRYVPSRWAGGGAQPFLHLIILGGNELASGQEGLLYAAEVTPTKIYDPEDPDETYPAGLGPAWLVRDGTRISKVLARHDFIGHTGAVIAGRQVKVAATVDVTYDSTPQIAYTIDWM